MLAFIRVVFKESKGRFTHNMLRPCRPPAMPYRQGFRMCLSHLIYTVRPCQIHTCHAAPVPSPTMPFFSRPRHSMAVEKEPVDYLPAFGFFRLSRGVPRNYYRRLPISDAGGQCETKHRLSWTRKSVVAGHYKKDDLLHCWTSSRLFPAPMRTFTKDTALSEQGRSVA